MQRFRQLLAFGVVALGVCLPAPAADVPELLKTLKAVGPLGAGQREAARAWAELARADAAALPAMLAALDDANPLAANWIRTAIDAAVERRLGAHAALPKDELEKFVRQRQHSGPARRLAYELLIEVDPGAGPRLIPGMLDDPSLELRRDAVAAVADQAAAMEKAERTGEAVAAYRRALSSARDLDQIQTLAGRLRGLHQTVDLPRHFGFIVHWQLIGPLDNTGHKGFDAVYPPEREVDLSASYPGKHGTLHWVEHVTKQDYGMVDFNQVLGEEKSVVGYAATTFVAAKEREVEFRLASFSAVKLWLNGQLIDQHNVYHNGSQMDQYVSRGVLRAGPNRILVKACQTNLTQEWARVWQFQLRVCDQRGTAVLSADRRPPAEQLSGKQGNTGFRHDSIEGPKA